MGIGGIDLITLQELLVNNHYNLFKVGVYDLKENPAAIPQDVQKRVSILAVPCYTIYVDELRFKNALDIRVGAALPRLEAARAAYEFNGDPNAEETIQSPETHTVKTPQITHQTVTGERVRTDTDAFGVGVNAPTVSPVVKSTDAPYTNTDTTVAHDVVTTTAERKTTKQHVMTPQQAYQRREAYNAEVFDCLTEILRGAVFEAQCFR